MPRNPDHAYKNNGWKGWGDFLGSGNVRGKMFRSYKEVKKYAQSLRIKSENEWYKHTKNKDENNNPKQSTKSK